MRKTWMITMACCLLAVAPQSRAETAKPAKLVLQDTHGVKSSLGDLRGKVVVLNFWATWCGPCVEEMPMLVKAAANYKDRNVVFIGASVDAAETQNKVPAYIQKLSMNYPIWEGATDDDMRKLKMGGSVPSTAFIDADGVVRMRVMGQMQPGEIEQRVDWLIGDQHQPMPDAIVTHLDKK
jgi:thiol-disulfide isomerase/thioredoxin